MTTDVINGVPRSLLERCVLLAQDAMGLDFDEHAAIERDIRELLATAQPADHSEHDLNMVSQPAADGEREVWAVPVLDGEKKTTFYTEQLPFVPGIGVKQLGEPVRMVEARAAQPAADGEREAFEAGINPHCRKRNEHGDYVVPEIQDRWEGWQARAALPAKAEGVAVPAVDREFRKFTTSEGGRGYVAEWFKNVLSRYDYTRYINERLAADFACTLADALYQLAAAPVPPAAHKTGEEE